MQKEITESARTKIIIPAEEAERIFSKVIFQHICFEYLLLNRKSGKRKKCQRHLIQRNYLNEMNRNNKT